RVRFPSPAHGGARRCGDRPVCPCSSGGRALPWEGRGHRFESGHGLGKGRGGRREGSKCDLSTLVRDGCKRKNYTRTKNKKKTTDKLAFRKFCPACRSHTVHKEGKV